MGKPSQIIAIKQFVKNSFLEFHNGELPFHNYQHIKEKVKTAEKVAKHQLLSEADHVVLISSLLLREMAFLIKLKYDRSDSAKSLTNFLSELNIGTAQMERINILTQALPTPPGKEDPLLMILEDLDFYYLGRKSFFKDNEALRKENNILQENRINKKDWLLKIWDLISGFRFQTEFLHLLLNRQLQKNINRIKKIISDWKEKQASLQLLKAANDIPEKGIETVFRIASANNQRMSSMADNKAHILITVNAIILSAVVSLILRKLSEQPYLMWPTFMLVAMSLATMVLAIIATRPHIFSGIFTTAQLDANQANLLFFGNFYKVNRADYRTAMLRLMESKDMLYTNLIYDIHGQGVALAKKYHLLRTAYIIFIYGLVISIFSFLIATLWNVNLS